MNKISGFFLSICIFCVSSNSSERYKITEIKKYTDVIISNLIKKDYLELYKSRPQSVNKQESFDHFKENTLKIINDSISEFLYHEKILNNSAIAVYYKSNNDTEVIKIIVEPNKREYEFIKVELIKADYESKRSKLHKKRVQTVQEKVEIGLLFTILALAASLIIFSIAFGGSIDLPI